MGSKYMIFCSKYPYKGITDYEYQTKWFIKAVFKLMLLKNKYEIIDFKIRW